MARRLGLILVLERSVVETVLQCEYVRPTGKFTCPSLDTGTLASEESGPRPPFGLRFPYQTIRPISTSRHFGTLPAWTTKPAATSARCGRPMSGRLADAHTLKTGGESRAAAEARIDAEQDELEHELGADYVRRSRDERD
jgi:hypothetical protein